MGNDAEVVHQGKGRHSRLWSDVCLCHQLHHRCGTQKARISDGEQIGLVEKETERFATCSGDALEVALRNREQS